MAVVEDRQRHNTTADSKERNASCSAQSRKSGSNHPIFPGSLMVLNGTGAACGSTTQRLASRTASVDPGKYDSLDPHTPAPSFCLKRPHTLGFDEDACRVPGIRQHAI